MFPLHLSHLLLHLVLGVQEPMRTSAGVHYQGYAVSGLSARRQPGVTWVQPNQAMLGTPRSTVRALEVAGRAGASHPVIMPEYYCWQYCFRRCRRQHSRQMRTMLCCACPACDCQVWDLEEEAVAHGVVSIHVTVVVAVAVAVAAAAAFEGVERSRRARLPARRGPRPRGGRSWRSTHVDLRFRRNLCWCPGVG